LGSAKTLVLDAGTGIRALGNAMLGRDVELFVLLSHNHWDRVQGFPFFAPIYQPHRRIYGFPTPQGHTLLCSLLEQMDGPHFPVTPNRLPSIGHHHDSPSTAIGRERKPKHGEHSIDDARQTEEGECHGGKGEIRHVHRVLA
jgi:phosphoribosyl 1,2-cyclic phosphodiesterase